MLVCADGQDGGECCVSSYLADLNSFEHLVCHRLGLFLEGRGHDDAGRLLLLLRLCRLADCPSG